MMTRRYKTSILYFGGWLTVALLIASTSARSCGLPDANFAVIRSSRQMKLAVKPLAGPELSQGCENRCRVFRVGFY
jgi:hypothetical protein